MAVSSTARLFLVASLLVAATACSEGDLLEQRPVSVREPAGYQEGTPAPLLVVLHGYGLTAQLETAYLGVDAVADANGMLVVAPEGTKNAEGKQYWNATKACCAPDGANDVDDSAYLAAVIDDVSTRYEVDDRRVFVLGHSNGGFMAYRMACDHADVIAAVASLEGAMTSAKGGCDPSGPVSVLEIHGTADKVIKYEGGASPTADATYPGAEQTVADWAELSGCDTPAVAGTPPNRTLMDGLPPATVQTYGGCDDDAVAELWTQPDGSHQPPLNSTFTAQVVEFLLAHPKS